MHPPISPFTGFEYSTDRLFWLSRFEGSRDCNSHASFEARRTLFTRKSATRQHLVIGELRIRFPFIDVVKSCLHSIVSVSCWASS